MTSIVYGQGTPGGGFDTVPQNKLSKQFQGFNPSVPPMPSVTSGSVPQMGQSTFGAGNNLISSQFTPQPSGRLQGAEGMTSNAASNFASIQNAGATPLAGPDYSKVYAAMGSIGGAGGGMPTASYGQHTTELQGKTLADLEKVRSGSDRNALAADAYSLMEERGRPEFENRVRQLNQQTAALGRIGSGIYGSNLTDLNSERERELSLSRKELANQASGQSLADRLAVLNATQGVQDQFSQGDVRMAGINAGSAAGLSADRWRQAEFLKDLADSDYGAKFQERGYGDSRSDVNFDRSRSQFTTLGDYEQGLRGNERTDRDEMRGERDYQYGLERDARGDFDRDRSWQYGVGRDRVDDQRYLLDQLNQFGYSGNPSGIMGQQSQNLRDSGAAGMEGLSSTLGEYLYQQQMRQRQPQGGAPQYQPQPYDDRTV